MPSRKPAKPLQEPTASETVRHTNALLEKLRAEFQVFGEGLTAVLKRLDHIEPLINQTAKDANLLSGWARKFSLDLQSLRTDVGELKTDMKDVKERLATVEAR